MNFTDLFQLNIKKASINGDEIQGLCPFHKDTNPSFSGNINTGLWTCYSCNEKGNAYQFAQKMKLDPKPYIGNTEKQTKPSVIPGSSAENLVQKYHNYLLDHWTKLSLNIWHKTIIKYCKIGYDQDKECFVFPIYGIDGTLLNVRWHKHHQLKGIHGTFWFPAKFVNEYEFKDSYIVWCEGEKDCITLLSKGIPAITNTNGVGAIPESLNILTRFKDIYICFDPDAAGIKGRKKVIEMIKRKLPRNNIYIATTPQIDITDWIQE